MQRIMLATDFSERSDRALRRAVLLARAHGVPIDLVHVVDDDRPRRIVDHESGDARAILRDLSRSLQAVEGVTAQPHVVLSDPFAGIVAEVVERKPDLLIVGPHRRQILKDAFVGTTAERTIRSVSCPVLMVNGPPVGPWRHVMLTTDLSEGAAGALRHFDTLGLGREGRLSVLHVFNAPAMRLAMSGALPRDDRQSYLDDQRTEARQALSRFMADLGNWRAEQIVRHQQTSSAADILATATEIKADLIVMATQGRAGLSRMVLGSVTQQVLQSADVDVLAIPPQGAA